MGLLFRSLKGNSVVEWVVFWAKWVCKAGEKRGAVKHDWVCFYPKSVPFEVLVPWAIRGDEKVRQDFYFSIIRVPLRPYLGCLYTVVYTH